MQTNLGWKKNSSHTFVLHPVGKRLLLEAYWPEPIRGEKKNLLKINLHIFSLLFSLDIAEENDCLFLFPIFKVYPTTLAYSVSKQLSHYLHII